MDLQDITLEDLSSLKGSDFSKLFKDLGLITCGICFENVDVEDDFTTVCSHLFHKKCIHNFMGHRIQSCRSKCEPLSAVCPICRTDLVGTFELDNSLITVSAISTPAMGTLSETLISESLISEEGNYCFYCDSTSTEQCKKCDVCHRIIHTECFADIKEKLDELKLIYVIRGDVCLDCVFDKLYIQKALRIISEDFQTDFKFKGNNWKNFNPIFCIPHKWFVNMFVLLKAVGVGFRNTYSPFNFNSISTSVFSQQCQQLSVELYSYLESDKEVIQIRDSLRQLTSSLNGDQTILQRCFLPSSYISEIYSRSIPLEKKVNELGDCMFAEACKLYPECAQKLNEFHNDFYNGDYAEYLTKKYVTKNLNKIFDQAKENSGENNEQAALESPSMVVSKHASVFIPTGQAVLESPSMVVSKHASALVPAEQNKPTSIAADILLRINANVNNPSIQPNIWESLDEFLTNVGFKKQRFV